MLDRGVHSALGACDHQGMTATHTPVHAVPSRSLFLAHLDARDSSSENRASERGFSMTSVSVRYIVNSVEESIDFYCGLLGFREVMHPAPNFAMLAQGDLRLVLSAPGSQGGGGQSMPDGTVPRPGGWNRFALEVEDLDATVARLRSAGAAFRNDIVDGVGGRQILVDDPSGNPVELFQPTIAERSEEHTSELQSPC